MPKVQVILENAPDCELANEIVDVQETDDTETQIDHAVQEVIEGWILSVGDTIKIRLLEGGA